MILMNDFKAEPAELREAMASAAARVFASGWYVLGTEVQAFERRWAEACGTRHCVGVANGMDAIELALRALDIGPGAEVITTPMTAFATVLAMLTAMSLLILACSGRCNTSSLSMMSSSGLRMSPLVSPKPAERAAMIASSEGHLTSRSMPLVRMASCCLTGGCTRSCIRCPTAL